MNWTVNISSTMSRSGDIFSYTFPSTPSVCMTEQLVYAENYTIGNVFWNTRYYYTVKNDTGAVIYDMMPGYLAGGNKWYGNLTVNGSLIVTGNIFTSGCVVYNGGTLGACV